MTKPYIFSAMNIWMTLLVVGLLGVVGGITNCLLSGEFALPHSDAAHKVWKPGWIANIVVGAVAAVVVWGVYGPVATYDLTQAGKPDIHLPVAQLVSSILVGISGAKILTTMAQKEAERAAKIDLAKVLEDIVKAQK
jgi:hypothetical protein